MCFFAMIHTNSASKKTWKHVGASAKIQDCNTKVHTPTRTSLLISTIQTPDSTHLLLRRKPSGDWKAEAVDVVKTRDNDKSKTKIHTIARSLTP